MDSVPGGTEQQMHPDTLNWPTHQSPHQPTHVVSKSADSASMSSHFRSNSVYTRR